MSVGRPRILVLCCKAGGAAMGYHRAGFDVVGLDLEPQPRFPFTFVQGDALTYPLDGFNAYHASPPCQANLLGLAAVNRKLGRDYAHADIIDPIRQRLRATSKPFNIEQPEQGARLVNPVRLCGSSFGLPIRRHRQFESSVGYLVPQCDHSWQTERKYWTGWRPNGEHRLATVVQVYGNGANRHEWPAALGIDWMTPDELTQAIPPAYTEFLGRQMLAYLTHAVAA
jgi:hypothetical protein